MTWTRHIEKVRKLAFGLAGLGFLAWGLAFARSGLPAPKEPDAVSVGHIASAVVALYGTFEAGVWLIVGAVILGNVGEHLANAIKKAPEPPGGAP